VALDAQRAVDLDTALLVEREAELGQHGRRADAGGPDERAGQDPLAVRECRSVELEAVESRPDA
jgi:hypothetical protein